MSKKVIPLEVYRKGRWMLMGMSQLHRGEVFRYTDRKEVEYTAMSEPYVMYNRIWAITVQTNA